MFAGLRHRTSTFVYDDPEHPDRPTRLIHSPAWTPEDRALLLGLEAYEDTLCPGCGIPKDRAWHSEWDGFYEATKVVCHACSASKGEGDEVAYAITVDTRPADAPPPPPFKIGETTSEPTDHPPIRR